MVMRLGMLLLGPFAAFQHMWFVNRGDPNTALDTTLRRDERTYPYGGVPLRWSYVVRRVAADGATVSVLEGDAGPPGGPPTCAGVDLPEPFLEPLQTSRSAALTADQPGTQFIDALDGLACRFDRRFR